VYTGLNLVSPFQQALYMYRIEVLEEDESYEARCSDTLIRCHPAVLSHLRLYNYQARVRSESARGLELERGNNIHIFVSFIYAWSLILITRRGHNAVPKMLQ
jgi:hypothetical protein